MNGANCSCRWEPVTWQIVFICLPSLELSNEHLKSQEELVAAGHPWSPAKTCAISSESWSFLLFSCSVMSNSLRPCGDGTPLQCSCLENPMDGGAWWAAVHGVAGSQTRLSDFGFTFHFHALETEMATHSRRIPGTGEPGGLLSMGSHRVGHD